MLPAAQARKPGGKANMGVLIRDCLTTVKQGRYHGTAEAVWVFPNLAGWLFPNFTCVAWHTVRAAAVAAAPLLPPLPPAVAQDA